MYVQLNYSLIKKHAISQLVLILLTVKLYLISNKLMKMMICQTSIIKPLSNALFTISGRMGIYLRGNVYYDSVYIYKDTGMYSMFIC